MIRWDKTFTVTCASSQLSNDAIDVMVWTRLGQEHLIR
jgi:hypothetical protein